ncbi:hypothetical protein HEP87_61175 [Streptomyces sp. S1D4-11]|nr:hypothetical protein [Streptomyces sp. S1D4-11]
MARRTAAVLAISLTVVLAAAACSAADHVAAQPTTNPSRTTASASAGALRAAGCGTHLLRWKPTRLSGKPRSAATALLSATNTGTTPCAFDGYPSVDVRPPHPARNDYGASMEMTDAHGPHLPAAVCGVIVQSGSPRLRRTLQITHTGYTKTGRAVEVTVHRPSPDWVLRYSPPIS